MFKVILLGCVCLLFTLTPCLGGGKGGGKNGGKGCSTDMEGGNISVKCEAKKRGFCCLSAKWKCYRACRGKPCDAKCTVKCGWGGWKVCKPISCQVANPRQCVPSTTTTTSTTTTSTATTSTTVTTTSTTTTTTTTTTT